MEHTRKIKDIYNCVAIISDEELSPLEKWYNQLIEKTVSEITVADVLRMIRQKELVKLAMQRAIELLWEDVFIGEMYDGELLEKISELDSSFLLYYADALHNIIKNALDKGLIHEWSYDGEEEEFKKIVSVIAKKQISNL